MIENNYTKHVITTIASVLFIFTLLLVVSYVLSRRTEIINSIKEVNVDDKIKTNTAEFKYQNLDELKEKKLISEALDCLRHNKIFVKNFVKKHNGTIVSIKKTLIIAEVNNKLIFFYFKYLKCKQVGFLISETATLQKAYIVFNNFVDELKLSANYDHIERGTTENSYYEIFYFYGENSTISVLIFKLTPYRYFVIASFGVII